MRVGLVGTGGMGSTHAAAWVRTPATLVGVVAETVEEAEPLARRYGVRVYPSLDEMLGDVDVVDVCTPTHLHYEMVMQAAAAGKQVICEKPLGRTVEQGQEMIAACKQAGVRLLVAHVVRYFPEYALAQAQVAAGRIGKPGVLRLRRGSYRPMKAAGNWFMDEAKSGGMMVDLMIHDFDYARWIAGEVESVYAKSITGSEPGAALDYGLVILRHSSGAISHIAGAWAYPPPTFRTGLEIAGDGGLIEFSTDESAPIKQLLHSAGHEDAPDVALPASPLSQSPYAAEIAEFYAAISENRPVRVTAEDGLAALQIALAAVESAKTGRAIEITALPEVMG